MTEKSNDLADVKTGNINLQPIKDTPVEVQRPVPIRTVFDPPPSLPPSEFQNGTFLPGGIQNDLLSSQGINAVRPEIIAHTVFEPVWDSNIAAVQKFITGGTISSPTAEPTQDMIKTQWSARKIREENLKKFVEYLKNDSQTKDIMSELSDLFNESIETATENVENIKNIWIKFDEIIYALDMYTSRVQIQNWRNNVESETDEALYTFDEVFSKLGFNPIHLQFWTNTKVVGQLLLDLSYAVRLYSLELFSDYVTGPIKTIKNTRIGDNNPFDYSIPNYSAITKYDVMSGKNSLSPIEKYLTDETLQVRNAFSSDQPLLFNTGTGDLQRLRVLATTLSRILGLSRVYTDTEFSQSYLNVFAANISTTKNFIRTVIGNTTKTIVDPITSGITSGQNVIGQPITTSRTSLHSLQIIDGEDKILPLERRDVSSTGTNTVTGRSGYDHFFQGLTSTVTTAPGTVAQNAAGGQTLSTTRIRQFKDTIRNRVRLATRMIEVGCLTDTVSSREKNNQVAFDSLRADEMLLKFRTLIKTTFSWPLDDDARCFRALCFYAIQNGKLRELLIRYVAAACIVSTTTPTLFMQRVLQDLSDTSFLDNVNYPEWKDVVGYQVQVTPSLIVLNDDALSIAYDQIHKQMTHAIAGIVEEIFGKKFVKPQHLLIQNIVHVKSIFTAFIDLIQQIEDAAGAHTDTSGKTWHMHVSTSTRFVFYIDMLITMIGGGKLDQFVDYGNDPYLYLAPLDYNKQDTFFSDINNPFIDLVVEGCRKDRYLIQSMTSLLRSYVDRINFFVNKATFVADPRYRDILVSKQQTALSMLELDDVKWSIEQGSIFSDDNSIQNPLLSLMLDKLFKIDKFREKNLTRILTLGLCPGTNSIIEGQDRTTKFDIPRKNWRSSDFVNIKVYVKNLLEEDVVFKPLEFPFELSRFVNMRSFAGLNETTVSSKSYDDIVRNHISFLDTSVMQASVSERHTGVEAENFERYQNVKAMSMTGGGSIFGRAIRNHVTSYLLGLYIKLLSGVSTQEKSFLLEPDYLSTVSTAVTDGLYRQLSEILIAKNSATITLQQFLDRYPIFAQKLQAIQEGQFGAGLFEDATIIDPSVFETADALVAEDLLDISKLMSVKSSITAGEKVETRIRRSKLFERIFNIPVYLPDFEIDTKLTKSTYSGGASYTRLNKAGMLMFKGSQSEKVYYKWNHESMQALQMWMTISTIDVGGMQQATLTLPKENPLKNQLGSAILEPTIPQLPLPQPPKSKLNQLPPQLPPPQPSQPIKNILQQLPPPPPQPKPPPPPKKTQFKKF